MKELLLRDKTAIVGGASQGIGRATAMILAHQGARIIALARGAEALKGLINDLPIQYEGQIHRVESIDYEDLKSLQRLGDELVEQQPVHIVVNNSGGPPGGALMEAEIDDFIRAITRHLFAFHTLTRCVVPSMKKTGYGRIINVISTSVKQPIPGLGVSNTTRAAVASWAKTLAGEIGGFGITVNNVLPGATRTGRLESLIDKWAKERGKTPESLAEGMQQVIPAGRFGEPEEIAKVIAFLASPDASYVNGVSLAVDGGRTKCL